MNNLPEDIIFIIQKMYWELVYNDIVKDINMVINFDKILRSYKYSSIIQTKDKLEEICSLCNQFKILNQDKGHKLLLKKINKYLFYSNIFTNPKIGVIYNYLCSKSGFMRYYVYHDYHIMINKLLKE